MLKSICVIVAALCLAAPARAGSVLSQPTLFGSGSSENLAKGLYVDVAFSTNVAAVAVDGANNMLVGSSFGPVVGAGFQFLPLKVGAHVGFSALPSVFGQGFQGGANFGLDVQAFLFALPMWPVRFYVKGSGDSGPMVLDPGSIGTGEPNGVFVTGGASLSVGGTYAICGSRQVSFEAGYRDQFININDTVSQTGSVFITASVTFLPFASCDLVPKVAIAPPPTAEEAASKTAAETANDDGTLLAQKSEPQVKDKNSPCESHITDGWFEPSQGAWQDDPIFSDKLAALERQGPNPVYVGRLEMVKDRPTVLVGVHDYKVGTNLVPIRSRRNIVFRGVSNCSKPKEVKAVFSLTDPSGTREVYTSDIVAQIPLDGPALDRALPWSVEINAYRGLPADKTFTFTSVGNYNLSGELVTKAGEKTGLKVQVGGTIVSPAPLALSFVPVALSDDGAKRPRAFALTKQTAALAELVRRQLGDLLPVGTVSVNKSELAKFTPDSPDFKLADVGGSEVAAQDRVGAALAERLIATLGTADRVIAVLTPDDFDLVADSIGGLAADTRVIFVRADADVQTVARELAYTVPSHLFAEHLSDQCGRNFYKSDRHWANGIRLSGERKQWDAPYGAATEFSSDGDKSGWLTQCSYANIVRHQPMAVTNVLVVHGVLSSSSAAAAGSLPSDAPQKSSLKLGPAIALQATADANEGPQASLQVMLESADGKVLSQFGAQLAWDSGDGHTRKLIPFAVRVPMVAGATRVVVTAGGASAPLSLTSVAAPAESEPAAGGGRHRHGTKRQP